MVSAHDDTEDLTFPNLPPFPDDVPTVPLLRLSLRDLLSNSPTEEEKLWRACCDLGFFYLDLRSSPQGTSLLSSAESLFQLGQEVFNLSTSEKAKYDFASKNSYFGYKSLGGGIIDKTGTRDKNEFWNVSKDDFLSETPQLDNPEILRDEGNRRLIREFMLMSHGVAMLVLEKLNGRLGLPEGTLKGLHRLEKASGDQMRWVKSPPQPVDERQVALGAHTDFGSVTILFNRLGGLQVLPPNKDTWAYVKPLNGHCVVNLGDALVKFTAGILRSNIHRVVNPPGVQEDSMRFSLVYFNRPEDDVILKTLEGSPMIDEKRKESNDWDDEEESTAKDWILRRALMRRVGGDYDKGAGTEGKRVETGYY